MKLFVVIAVLTLFFTCALVGQSTPAKPSAHAGTTSQSKGSIPTTVLIDTDDTCELMVDGEPKGRVSSEASSKIALAVGQHILKCTVKEAPDLVWRKVVDVKDETQVALVISLKALHLEYNESLEEVKRQKEQQLAAEHQRLVEAEEVTQSKTQELVKHVTDNDWYLYYTAQNEKKQTENCDYTLHFLNDETGNHAWLSHSCSLTRRFGVDWPVKEDWFFNVKPQMPNAIVSDGAATCRVGPGEKNPSCGSESDPAISIILLGNDQVKIVFRRWGKDEPVLLRSHN